MKADPPPRSAAGGSSSSERPSGRRVRGLCHSPASRCPLSETTSPHSVAGKCPSCTRGSGAAPPTHTHTCVAADPGTPRPPAAPRSPPGSVPADGRLHVDVSEFHEETAVTFSQLSDELLWDYVDSGEPMCVPGPGSGAGDAGGDVPGAGARCGGGPRPLCPLRSCRQPSGPPQRHWNGAPRAGGRAPACAFAGHRHQACDGRGHRPLVGTARGQDRLSHRLGPGAGAEALAADRSWGHVHSL